MAQMYRVLQGLWRKPAFRLLASASFAALLGVAASRTLLGSVVLVEGSSMTPAYPPGAQLYATPITTPLDRSEVVLLDDGHADYAVKRIIGLPGETVQLWRGVVFVNRKVLVEPYLPAHTYTFPIERARRGATYVLGDDEYFVLGDNRVNSSDSRTYGPVPRKHIKRRVPEPDGFVSAYFGHYTLPDYGHTVMRALNPAARTISPF